MASRLSVTHSQVPSISPSTRPSPPALRRIESKLDAPIGKIIQTHFTYYQLTLRKLLKLVEKHDGSFQKLEAILKEVKNLVISTFEFLQQMNLSLEAEAGQVLFDHLRKVFFSPHHPLLERAALDEIGKNYWRYVLHILEESLFNYKPATEEIRNTSKYLSLFLHIATNIKPIVDEKEIEIKRDRRMELRRQLRDKAKDQKSDSKSSCTDEPDSLRKELALINAELEALSPTISQPTSLKGIDAAKIGSFCLAPGTVDLLDFIYRFEKHLTLKTKPCCIKGLFFEASALPEREQRFLQEVKLLREGDPTFIKKLFLGLDDTLLEKLRSQAEIVAKSNDASAVVSSREFTASLTFETLKDFHKAFASRSGAVIVDFNLLKSLHPELIASLFSKGKPENEMADLLRIGFHLLLKKHNLTETYSEFHAECVRRKTGPTFRC